MHQRLLRYWKVNKLIGDKDVFFSHLIVDGVNVYENHEKYIKKQMNKIMQLGFIGFLTLTWYI